MFASRHIASAYDIHDRCPYTSIKEGPPVIWGSLGGTVRIDFRHWPKCGWIFVRLLLVLSADSADTSDDML